MDEFEEYRPLSIQRWLGLSEPLSVYFLGYQVVVERHNLSFRIQDTAYDISRICARSCLLPDAMSPRAVAYSFGNING